MKRIHLPDEKEGGWSYDPSSIDHLIEARLRRDEIAESRNRQRTPASMTGEQLTPGATGLNDSELNAIWAHCWLTFLEGAHLSEELREEREQFRATYADRLKRFLKATDREIAYLAERHAVLFAQVCELAIKKVTGEFADLLTQAVIARRGRKDFPLGLRAAMWAECLGFSLKLTHFEAAGAWIDKAWGHAPNESPLPHLHTLGSMMLQQCEVNKFNSKFKARFEQRIRHASPEWLNEAERRIQLRTLLSSSPNRRVNLDDPTKLAIMNLLFLNPGIQTGAVCGKLDNANERHPRHPVAPLPEKWQKRGVRSWREAFEKFEGNVKSYVSKIRSEAGISNRRHR